MVGGELDYRRLTLRQDELPFDALSSRQGKQALLVCRREKCHVLAAGVSAATVSRVLNRSACVTDATRARVDSAIAVLGYRQNNHATYLSRERSKRNDIARPHTPGPVNGSPADAGLTRDGENQRSFVDLLRPPIYKCDVLRCQVND